MTTKISKSRLGDIRFPKHDKPFDNSVTTMKLTPEQMDHYLKTGELPNPKKETEKKIKRFKEITNEIKRKRGRPPKMSQAQEPENSVDKEELIKAIDSEIKLRELEEEVAELSKNNVKLKNLLDDLQETYNQLALDYETTNQVKYDLTRTEGQRDQLKLSLKETEEILFKEVDKRETLERALKLYLP